MIKYEEALEKLINDVFNGKAVGMSVRESIVHFVATKIMTGVFDGFGSSFSDVDYDTPDFGTLATLEKNVYWFGTAKNHHHLKELNEMLLDADGKIRSFSKFKELAQDVTNRYNTTWLQAEYEHAIASAQMTRRWQDIQDAKETHPNLRYDTAGDERVRPAHAEIEGVTLPIDDPFWQIHYPPNGWGCRCDVIQTDGKVTPDDKIRPPVIPDLFKTNTAIDGVVFPKGHPYYALPKKDKTKLKGNATRFWKANGEGAPKKNK